jgi:hypothetical protein
MPGREQYSSRIGQGVDINEGNLAKPGIHKRPVEAAKAEVTGRDWQILRVSGPIHCSFQGLRGFCLIADIIRKGVLFITAG